MSQILAVAWYRFRASFGRSWGGYLSLVLLIGLIGGIAMASIAAARRTQSSYPTFLASTSPSDMNVSVYATNSGAAVAPLTTSIAKLPEVKRVRAIVVPQVVPVSKNGAPRFGALARVTILGSLDGMLLDQDRPAVLQGRMADPRRTDASPGPQNRPECRWPVLSGCISPWNRARTAALCRCDRRWSAPFWRSSLWWAPSPSPAA